jgi:MOSC domain-containing protein YiiM
MTPHLAAIYISPSATELPVSVPEAEARTRRGLVGDRYYIGSGTFSDAEPKGPGRELTLIEGEVLEALEAEHGIRLTGAVARRNLVTQGIRLNELIGVTFRIGHVLVQGIRPCDPCTHLDKVTGMKLLLPLRNRGGLRASILSDGAIRVGDAIAMAEDS